MNNHSSGKAAFRPRARLLSLLGEQLISDQAVGLIELVKNAYDADATHVLVKLEGLKDPATTKITVRDDGCGMTLDDVEQKWLSPAVDHKERQKVARQRSPRGRLPIGEKGVGRFAVHQLGHQLELVSHAANAPEVVLRVNWDDFDRGDAYLEDLSVTLFERKPEVFVGQETGTLLLIEHSRALWKETLVSRIQRALRRLQSPHSQQQDFSISLACPEYPYYEQINPSDITDHAHYIFRGMVDQKGVLDFEYECHLPGLPERREADDNYNLLPGARQELAGPVPECGPFYLNLYVWDRSREYLVASGVSRDDLDAMAGVALFRDGLRVLPYGEPGNDWLDLDRERINDPSKRIGNQQIIGFVEVLQGDTPGLRDKTNREGLIENTAFWDLRALVRAAINVFSTQWLKDRPRPPDKERPRPPAGALQTARAIATAVATTARDDIVVDVGRAISKPEDSRSSADIASMAPVPLPVGVDEPSPLITQRQAMRSLVEYLDHAEVLEEQTQQEQEQRAVMLMHLAATGMAAERVVHEFGRQVHAALDALSTLRALAHNNGAIASSLDLLDACLGTLRNEFRVLAPYEANWRMQRTETVSLHDAIKLAVDLNGSLMDEAGIQVTGEGDDFEVSARPSSLVQALDNLLHNATVWLQTNEAGKRQIRVQLDAKSRKVLISDNGSGIPTNAQPYIFDAFYSLKNGGRGLGLYITRELLQTMQATIHLAPSPAWTGGRGAAFVIQFPDLK